MECDFHAAQQEVSVELSSSALIWHVLMEEAGNNHTALHSHKCRLLQEPNGPWLGAKGAARLCVCVYFYTDKHFKSSTKQKDKHHPEGCCFANPCKSFCLLEATFHEAGCCCSPGLIFIVTVTLVTWSVAGYNPTDQTGSRTRLTDGINVIKSATNSLMSIKAMTHC